MIPLILLLSLVVYFSLGMSCLRAHPRAAEMLTAAVFRPWPYMAHLARDLVFWPWTLARPGRRRGAGRP